MSISSTKSQKSSKSSSSNDNATKALVQQTVKLLNTAQSQFVNLVRSSPVVDKQASAKFRKGAEGIIPKIGTLIQNAGLDGGPLSVSDMLANLEQGQSLVPLLQQLESSASSIGALAFGAHTASWQAAMHGYAILQRMSLNDPALAKSLQPITDFMAYRHPSTTDGEPTKPAKKAAAKLRKAQKQVSQRVARAQSELTYAGTVLGGTTADPSAAASTAGATETATATAPATVAAVAAPTAATAAPAATTGH